VGPDQKVWVVYGPRHAMQVGWLEHARCLQQQLLPAGAWPVCSKECQVQQLHVLVPPLLLLMWRTLLLGLQCCCSC
jgi:hypothetical protein